MYRECPMCHGASLGNYASNGSGEFTPNDITSVGGGGGLICDACGCHRNFHRKVTRVAEMTDYGAGGGSGRLLATAYSPESSERISKKRQRTKLTEVEILGDLEKYPAQAESASRDKDHTATYFVVNGLMQDVEQHLSSYDNFFGSKQGFCPFTKEEIESLYAIVSLMDSLLRDSSGQSYDRELMNQVDDQRIRDVVHEAGNYLDFWAVLNPYLARERAMSEGSTKFPSIINEITQEMLSINEELKKIQDYKMVQDFENTISPGISFTCLSPSRRRTPNSEDKLVGLEKDLVEMLHSLTGLPLKLKVFPIIGMGGIGKTTFVKKLYDNPLVMHHFYVRIWLTVSQKYQVRQMLLGVLGCIISISDHTSETSDEELREQVYRSLKGKRYLIVLDDMWDTKAWDDLKRTFPDDKNGSRIMLTSRLRDVAVHASQDTPPYCLRCLNAQESWELLSSKIFLDESCPLELVEIGKQIACRCQGLPLAIVVIGGLLFKTNNKLDVWEKVARSLGSFVTEEADHCLNILALSYNHLPDHLKACFLYLGVFPEDYEISVKNLRWLWIAEGFILRHGTLKSLEEVAEDYLEDLTCRSLILVKSSSPGGRMKTCYIHDLMREVCLRESQKQDFFRVINNSGQLPSHGDVLQDLSSALVPPIHLHNPRRLSFHSSIRSFISNTSLPYTSSLMCFGKLTLSNPRSILGSESLLGMNFRLLKVLDIMHIHLKRHQAKVFELIQLKFLAMTFHFQNSVDLISLSRLRSLQILIVDCEWDGYLPRAFWDMLELRHFQMKRSYLSDSPTYSRSIASARELSEAELPLRVLNNLRSLSTIRPKSCTKEVFVSMPHLRKLGVYESEEDYLDRGWFKNLVHLRELETLKYVFSNPFANPRFKPSRLPSRDAFPQKLVKLTLSGTSLPWEDMLKLSMLPKLEVLKLRNYGFEGAVWKCMEGGFCCLNYLLIGSTNLETWEADGTPFPKLEHLVLRHCRYLKEIPYVIGEAPLLEKIELLCCKDSVVLSARNLQQEQESLGNDALTVHITEAY